MQTFKAQPRALGKEETRKAVSVQEHTMSSQKSEVSIPPWLFFSSADVQTESVQLHFWSKPATVALVRYLLQAQSESADCRD